MLLLALVLASCFHLLRIVNCQEFMVTRHIDGDIFTLEGSCKEACTILSSGTASPFSHTPSTAGLVAYNSSCTCQCNQGLPTFREDLQICVNDIHECSLAGFLSSSGQIERVPYVFLPQRGQIIYPHAEIRFEGVTTPVCGIAGAQQLGKSGWLELRNLSDAEPPLRLFRDEGRTFLQWIGESGLRDAAEGRIVITKLVCRDASPKLKDPMVFTPCVAFRVAGSPSKNNVREIMFSSSSQVSQGLSATEYAAIGLSSVILAVIYVASVSLYLHSRKTKRKSVEEAEVTLPGNREHGGIVKNNPLLVTSRHFESDTNSGLTESELGDELPQSDGEQGFEHSQLTSAIIHPHYNCLDNSEVAFGSGTILGERLPEEDVRVVETADSSHQQDIQVLPGNQRRKLYFNPAYFDRQLLLAPPPGAIEFLLKIREVISIAKHKMAAKRFVPTLNRIPEEETETERSSTDKQHQRQQGAVTNLVLTTKSKKSQKCSGCPGCTESHRNLSLLPDNEQPSPGESKVRAWLEDVKTPQFRWRNPSTQETRKDVEESTRTFAKSLEYLKELAKRDLSEPADTRNSPTKILSSWKDNPPMLRTFRNIAKSEILENDDCCSISRRSTKSMFECSNREHYESDWQNDLNGNEIINAKVRMAIENSFIEQMEENTVVENETTKKEVSNEEDKCVVTVPNAEQKKENSSDSTCSSKKAKKAPSKGELPDMINELPGSQNTAKRIMDKVIREMVDAKVLEHHSRSAKIINEYEVDSLERTKCSRKSSTSPASTDQSSPNLSTALPLDEELTMQNAVIDPRIGEMSKQQSMFERNYYNSLPELITQKSESYSLVSEVYVNDGYVSPAGSDDSGPEIQYEPENPGHLTIKVQDSPENYVKQDESEYEPDTLDRKPMKLRVNDEINYDKEVVTNEIFVDSLERPAQILLKSKGSFRDENACTKNGGTSLHRGYGSLREIYEARLKSNSRENGDLIGSNRSLNIESNDNTLTWKKTKYLTPDKRQAKRQRPPYNQPDVVPLPPTEDVIYQCPKPPRPVENLLKSNTTNTLKNAWDRSPVEAGNPTASNGSPVPNCHGYDVGNDCTSCHRTFQNGKNESVAHHMEQHNDDAEDANEDTKTITKFFCARHRTKGMSKDFEKSLKENSRRSSKSFDRTSMESVSFRSQGRHLCIHKRSTSNKTFDKFKQNSQNRQQKTTDLERNESQDKRSVVKCSMSSNRQDATGRQCKVEDSGYLSSTDSNSSHKRLLRHEVSSVSETDETESICDGASESGAESIGTDSVFFGNFRRLSEASSNFCKSIDSGVDVKIGNLCCQSFTTKNEVGLSERTNFSFSDSETESFVTVLPPDRS